MKRMTCVLVLGVLAVGCSSQEDSSSSSAGGAAAGATGGDFHSLVADPGNVGRVYVGGHDRVARSDDRGKTWRSVESLDGADAMGWSIAAGSIWVSGHPGLNVSRDGGSTFELRNDGLPDTDVHAFGASGDQLYAAGPGFGVASSPDGGLTWLTVTDQAGQAFFGRMLVDPADPAHVVAADARVGVSESRDGGRSWRALGTEPVAWVSSPDGLATIYASGGATALRSGDGGATWAAIGLPAGATLVEAGARGTLYAGVHDGNAVTVWVSSDDGVHWASP